MMYIGVFFFWKYALSNTTVKSLDHFDAVSLVLNRYSQFESVAHAVQVLDPGKCFSLFGGVTQLTLFVVLKQLRMLCSQPCVSPALRLIAAVLGYF